MTDADKAYSIRNGSLSQLNKTLKTCSVSWAIFMTDTSKIEQLEDKLYVCFQGFDNRPSNYGFMEMFVSLGVKANE